MTRIKLCGLTRPADIEISNRLRPEYVGFVFAPASRRYIAPEKAEKLKKALDPSVQAVGVFVDEDLETIALLLNKGVIDLAQLHGSETEEDIRQLKERTGKPVIRAFRPGQVFTEDSCADYVLLDSGAGSGRTLDWRLLKTLRRPFFLAGGLHPGNVTEAIRILHPYAVDVSSGIETDGQKDPAKMEAFVRAVRACRETA